MNKIVAVVVTYNRLDMLKKCISCLENQTIRCDIIIVNNASTDDTEKWALEYTNNHNSVLYKNTGKNIGGAGGFNLGMKWAIENDYEYIWIMDDDCLVKEDSLQKLIEADNIIKKENDYGFLSSVVLWTNEKECKMNRQKIRKSYYEDAHLLKHGIIQVEQATFVSLLFNRKTIVDVGLPIKDFFIWGDDIEYTRRITVRNGLKSYMVGQSQVIHAMKENTGSSIATDIPERINRYKYAFRNEGYLYRQEGLKGIFYYFAKCMLNLFRILIKAKNYKLKRCSVLICSMVKGLFFNPKIEYID